MCLTCEQCSRIGSPARVGVCRRSLLGQRRWSRNARSPGTGTSTARSATGTSRLHRLRGPSALGTRWLSRQVSTALPPGARPASITTTGTPAHHGVIGTAAPGGQSRGEGSLRVRSPRRVIRAGLGSMGSNVTNPLRPNPKMVQPTSSNGPITLSWSAKALMRVRLHNCAVHGWRSPVLVKLTTGTRMNSVCACRRCQGLVHFSNRLEKRFCGR